MRVHNRSRLRESRACAVCYAALEPQGAGMLLTFGHVAEEVGPQTEFSPEEPDSQILSVLRHGTAVDVQRIGIVGVLSAEELLNAWERGDALTCIDIADDPDETIYVHACVGVGRNAEVALIGPFTNFLAAEAWIIDLEGQLRDREMEGNGSYVHMRPTKLGREEIEALVECV